MAQRQSLYDLVNTGDKVLLEGTLSYSSLLKKRAPKFESKYNNDPRYNITITDPKVVDGGDTELGKHILDEGITHGSYKNKEGQTVWSFDDSKSRYPFNIYTKETGDEYVAAPDILENELAPGQTVGVLFSIKHSEAYDRDFGVVGGIVIDSPTDIKYLSAGSSQFTDMLGKSKHKKTLAEIAAENKGGKSTDAPADSSADSKPAAKSETSEKDLDQEADDLFE